MKKNKFGSWILNNIHIIALCILLFSIVTPVLFTRPSIFNIFDFSETGQIGDTINGIMGSFIAIGAALLTFAAFYIQKQANDIQTETINKQATQDEIQKIESKLFSYIDLHRRNVSELKVERNFLFRSKWKIY